MLIHVPRVALAILRGRAQRARSAAGEGWGFTKPHVYAARAGPLFDVDGMGHMNNSAYLVHCELARWELTAASGVLDYVLKQRAAFIVGMTAIQYKREIKPFQRFEIHSQLIASDDKWMTIAHEFRKPESGDILALTVCRAVLKQRGGTCSPRALLKDIGLDIDACQEPRPELRGVLDSSEALHVALRDAARAPAPPDRL